MTLNRAANGTLSFMGGIPRDALTNDFKRVEANTLVEWLAGGGYSIGVSGEVNDEISAENFFSLVNTLLSLRV